MVEQLARRTQGSGVPEAAFCIALHEDVKPATRRRDCDGLAIQIAFNTLWTPVFFGLRRMKAALTIIGVLWLAVLSCAITHWQLDAWAGLAFLPYLTWVTVAGTLNCEMVRLNPDVAPLELDRID